MVSTATCNDKADNFTNNDPQRKTILILWTTQRNLCLLQLKNMFKSSLDIIIPSKASCTILFVHSAHGFGPNGEYEIWTTVLASIISKMYYHWVPPLPLQIFCINQPKSAPDSRSQGTLFLTYYSLYVLLIMIILRDKSQGKILCTLSIPDFTADTETSIRKK